MTNQLDMVNLNHMGVSDNKGFIPNYGNCHLMGKNIRNHVFLGVPYFSADLCHPKLSSSALHQ